MKISVRYSCCLNDTFEGFLQSLRFGRTAKRGLQNIIVIINRLMGNTAYLCMIQHNFSAKLVIDRYIPNRFFAFRCSYHKLRFYRTVNSRQTVYCTLDVYYSVFKVYVRPPKSQNLAKSDTESKTKVYTECKSFL